MESDAVLQRLRQYMSMEQEFYHHKFMEKAKKIDDVDELVEIIDLLHSNYLIRQKLFTNLAHYVAEEGFELPCISVLLRDSQ
jgi:hypothetical protein